MQKLDEVFTFRVAIYRPDDKTTKCFFRPTETAGFGPWHRDVTVCKDVSPVTQKRRDHFKIIILFLFASVNSRNPQMLRNTIGRLCSPSFGRFATNLASC
jgi:hypothetical protein